MNQGRKNRDIKLVCVDTPQPRYVPGRTFSADFNPRRDRAEFWGCSASPRKLTDAQPVIEILPERMRTILTYNLQRLS
jgi:hypothetical protein